jgi:hypothetical protein
MARKQKKLLKNMREIANSPGASARARAVKSLRTEWWAKTAEGSHELQERKWHRYLVSTGRESA